MTPLETLLARLPGARKAGNGWSACCPAHDDRKASLSVSAMSQTEPAGQVLLDVKAVAALIGCSPRNVFRLADGGSMPAPCKIGRLVRWSRSAIEQWIAQGCQATRKGVAR